MAYTSYGVQQTSPRGPTATGRGPEHMHAETSRERKLHILTTQNDFGFRQKEWDQSEEKQRCGLETALDLLRGRRAANTDGRVVEKAAPSVSVQASHFEGLVCKTDADVTASTWYLAPVLQLVRNIEQVPYDTR